MARIKNDFLSFIKSKSKNSQRTIQIYEDYILEKNPFLIIDGSNIFQQSFFASKGTMYNASGKETGGIFIFVNTLLNYIQSLTPKKVFCTVDYGMSARRASLFKDYKKGRKELRATKEALMGAEAAATERENYFYQFNSCVFFLKISTMIDIILKGIEADSSIAYVTKKIRDERENDKEPIIIISTDKDFYQLFAYENLFIFNPRSKQFIDKNTFHAKLELDENIIPEQLPLIRSITGDTSDSIPGVKLPPSNPKSRPTGIKGKTISKLYKEAFENGIMLTKFKDVKKFLSKKKDLKKFEKAILENKKLIDLNIQLMDLIHIEDYMSTSAMMKLDDLFEMVPELDSKSLHNLFIKNDCESLLLSFQSIKRILNNISFMDKRKTSGINWNSI